MADKKFTNGLFIYKSKIEGLLNWSAKKADYIKALQEADDKIDALEARITTLEG